MALTATKIFERVRGIVNRLPVYQSLTASVQDEVPSHDENVVFSGSQTISDETLLRPLNQVRKYIVNAVKVFHLPDSLQELVTVDASPTLSNDEIGGRYVHGTVKRVRFGDFKKVRARYRELSEHFDLETSGRGATEDYPAYTYNDHDIDVYPNPVEGSEVLQVLIPSSIRVENMAAGTDTLELDERFEGAIVAYVTAHAFLSIQNPTMYSLYMSMFNNKLEPLLIGTRIGEISKQLISSVEYEKENEIE